MRIRTGRVIKHSFLVRFKFLFSLIVFSSLGVGLYAVDFFEGLYPKKEVKAYRKHLVGLQSGLGYLNDVAVADRLLRELGAADNELSNPAWAYAGGIAIGWHRHAAIAAKDYLIKDMAAFLRAKPFWRGA